MLLACLSLLAHNFIPHTHHIDHIHLQSLFGSHNHDQEGRSSKADEPGHCPATDLSDCHLEDLAFTGKSKRTAVIPEAFLQYNPDVEAITPQAYFPHPVYILSGHVNCFHSAIPSILAGKAVPGRAPPSC